MYVHMYVCVYIRMHVCMYICMYVRMYVCMYVRMYVRTLIGCNMAVRGLTDIYARSRGRAAHYF